VCDQFSDDDDDMMIYWATAKRQNRLKHELEVSGKPIDK